MSRSFAVLDKGALDNDMATPIAKSAEHSEVSTTSSVAENVEQSKVSTADLIAENEEHSEMSTTSPIAKNVDQSKVSTTSLIYKNAEHSEGSATSLIAKDMEQSKVFTPSLIAKNTDLSEVLTTSLNTGKPKQSPILMNNPTVEELNARMSSKATTNGSEPEGDEEVAAALFMDKLRITNQVAADASNAKANTENVAPTSKSVSEVFLDMSQVPGEIRKRIIMFAMTANHAKLEFTNGVGPFKPNVATGLLRAR